MENQQGGNRREPGKADARQNNDENFPGYPHYDAEEDITAAGERVSANVEGVSRANSQTAASLSGAAETPGGGGGGANRPKSDAGHPVANTAGSPRSAADAETEADPDADVTPEDLMMLDRADRGVDESDDAQAPLRAQLDETDEDGDPLNEASGREGYMGDDIDVPGSETDDANENIGEEDEENNYYSLGGDEKSGLDDANEGSINRI
jgi:hypothetical protein